MHWELEELENALREGDTRLALRYASKLRELLFCPAGAAGCGEPIRWQAIEAVPYFKGYRHATCAKENK